MSEREPQDHRPFSLEYRDPRRDGEQQSLLKMGGGCLLTIFVVWLAISTFAVLLLGRKPAVIAGMVATVLAAAYALKEHRRGRARGFTAGIWIGTALSLLLVGLCSTIR